MPKYIRKYFECLTKAVTQNTHVRKVKRNQIQEQFLHYSLSLHRYLVQRSPQIA